MLLFFRNLSIAKKLLIAFTALVLVIAVAGAITVREIDVADSAAADQQAANTLAERSDRLWATANAQLMAIRGLLVTGNRDEIETFEANAATFEETYQAIMDADPPESTATVLTAISETVRTWQQDVAREQIRLMRQPLTVDEARVLEANGSGAAFIDRLSEQIAELDALVEARVNAASETSNTAFELTQIVAVAGSLAALLIAVIAFFGLKGSIASPIVRMTDVMGTLAEGDESVDVPSRNRRDEVGAMARALEVFKQNAIERKAALAREEEAREKEMEEVRAREARAKRMEELVAEFDSKSREVVDALAASSSELEHTAQTMNGLARNTDEEADSVSASSQEAASNVQTVASAAEELRTAIQEISQQVSSASGIAGDAATNASDAQAKVGRLETAARSIGEVVDLINEIAEQTNLLALNATIEAARAGEAGKGFAVVAEEVKSLASQTATATDKIRTQIEQMQSETSQSVEAMESIARVIGQVNDYTTAISAAVEEQSAATQEIATNIHQASNATDQVTASIQTVREAASESGTAADELLTASREIAERSNSMKSSIDGFLTNIRSL